MQQQQNQPLEETTFMRELNEKAQQALADVNGALQGLSQAEDENFSFDQDFSLTSSAQPHKQNQSHGDVQDAINEALDGQKESQLTFEASNFGFSFDIKDTSAQPAEQQALSQVALEKSGFVQQSSIEIEHINDATVVDVQGQKPEGHSELFQRQSPVKPSIDKIDESTFNMEKYLKKVTDNLENELAQVGGHLQNVSSASATKTPLRKEVDELDAEFEKLFSRPVLLPDVTEIDDSLLVSVPKPLTKSAPVKKEQSIKQQQSKIIPLPDFTQEVSEIPMLRQGQNQFSDSLGETESLGPYHDVELENSLFAASPPKFLLPEAEECDFEKSHGRIENDDMQQYKSPMLNSSKLQLPEVPIAVISPKKMILTNSKAKPASPRPRQPLPEVSLDKTTPRPRQTLPVPLVNDEQTQTSKHSVHVDVSSKEILLLKKRIFDLEQDKASLTAQVQHLKDLSHFRRNLSPDSSHVEDQPAKNNDKDVSLDQINRQNIIVMLKSKVSLLERRLEHAEFTAQKCRDEKDLALKDSEQLRREVQRLQIQLKDSRTKAKLTETPLFKSKLQQEVKSRLLSQSTQSAYKYNSPLANKPTVKLYKSTSYLQLQQKPPFVAGKVSSPADTVKSNIQRVWSQLKAHNPQNCDLCQRGSNFQRQDYDHALDVTRDDVAALVNMLEEERYNLNMKYEAVLKQYRSQKYHGKSEDSIVGEMNSLLKAMKLKGDELSMLRQTQESHGLHIESSPKQSLYALRESKRLRNLLRQKENEQSINICGGKCK